MDPNTQQPMNLDENPFAAILARGAQQPVQPEQPIQPQIPPVPGADEEVMGPEELQPGKTGDNTKPLLGAIQNLHAYIAASADQGTIQLVRNLISALTQLIVRDQKAAEQLAQQQMGPGQMQEGQSQEQTPTAPTQ